MGHAYIPGSQMPALRACAHDHRPVFQASNANRFFKKTLTFFLPRGFYFCIYFSAILWLWDHLLGAGRRQLDSLKKGLLIVLLEQRGIKSDPKSGRNLTWFYEASIPIPSL